MLNRRLLMAQAGATPPGSGIVTDGLTFRLNGLNQGNQPDKWIDEISGVAFDLIGCEKRENGIFFPDGSRAEYNSELSFFVTGTFEIVCDLKSVGRIFHPGGAGKKFLLNQYVRYAMIGTKSARLAMPIAVLGHKKSTFSTTADNTFMNKKPVQRGGIDYYSWNPKHAYIGAIPNDGAGMTGFAGIIHELRYYTRPLTEAEILQNQQYDIDTYFGGVIPE